MSSFLNSKIIRYKPVTPGLRNKVSIKKKYLIKKRTKELTIFLRRKNNFSNSTGSLVNYNRQFGNKKLYRLIDFKRSFFELIGKISHFEYDPNRNVDLALVKYPNNTISFILRLDGMNLNSSILNNISTNKIMELSSGSFITLKNIPVGTFISGIEIKPGKGSQLLRSAGVYGQVVQHNVLTTTIQFRSGLKKEVLSSCRALIGKISGSEFKYKKLGKAGVNRWLGKRPIVRGVAKNPVDHPHGGGNGKTSGGRPSVSRWGNYAKGVVKN